MNLILLEDHNIVREGFKSILLKKDNVDSVEDFSNGHEALEYLTTIEESDFPDLIITDVSMPKMSGIEFTEIVKSKYDNAKILVLSMHDNVEYINKAVESGADGYILKDSDRDELFRALDIIFSGDKYFSYNVSNILINKMLSNDQQDEKVESYSLSEREKEVLGLIVEGLSNKLIAAKLFVSTRTVDAHRYKIMQKLKVKNTAEMVRIAIVEKLC